MNRIATKLESSIRTLDALKNIAYPSQIEQAITAGTLILDSMTNRDLKNITLEEYNLYVSRFVEMLFFLQEPASQQGLFSFGSAQPFPITYTRGGIPGNYTNPFFIFSQNSSMSSLQPIIAESSKCNNTINNPLFVILTNRH